MDTLQVERADGIVTITFNRPERKNAINDQMWGELAATAAAIRDSSQDRCVVLTGAGGAFCSGQDLAGVSGDSHHLTFMRRINGVVRAFHDLPQPTIAKVDGVAAGVGLSFALGCDLVVASEEARFSAIFIRRGLSPDGGATWLLPRLIGLHRAKALALLGDVISAQDAQALGLLNAVVPAAELDALVDGWAGRLAAGPPIALALTKQMLNRSFDQTFEQALADEASCQTVNLGTKDTAEAVSAFFQKREPTFTGR